MVSRTTLGTSVFPVPDESVVQFMLRVATVSAELAEQRNELMSMMFFRVNSIPSLSVW